MGSSLTRPSDKPSESETVMIHVSCITRLANLANLSTAQAVPSQLVAIDLLRELTTSGAPSDNHCASPAHTLAVA